MIELSKKVEALLKSRTDVAEQIVELYAQKSELDQKLKEAQSQVDLICQDCSHTIVLAEAELIWEYYNERYCKIDEETYSSERLLWVCPSCHYITYVRDNDDPEWGNPKYLAKKVYKWHSGSGSRRPEDRASAILEPALKRRAEERLKREREQEIENARRVLRKHGEL